MQRTGVRQVTDSEAGGSRSVLATVEDEVLHLIDLAIEEDRGAGDWTSRWIVPARLRVRARVLAGAPGIVAGLTITLVSLIGYSAMAGAVGGGGLGDIGIRYGYQRFLPEVMLAVVLVLIVFVQGVQSAGDRLVRKLSHR